MTAGKKQRRVPVWQGFSPFAETAGPDSDIALWKAVHRDPSLPGRAAEGIALLAARLQRRMTRARLRDDHARALRLGSLRDADTWWKGRWQEHTGSDPGPNDRERR